MVSALARDGVPMSRGVYVLCDAYHQRNPWHFVSSPLLLGVPWSEWHVMAFFSSLLIEITTGITEWHVMALFPIHLMESTTPRG